MSQAPKCLTLEMMLWMKRWCTGHENHYPMCVCTCICVSMCMWHDLLVSCFLNSPATVLWDTCYSASVHNFTSKSMKKTIFSRPHLLDPVGTWDTCSFLKATSPWPSWDLKHLLFVVTVGRSVTWLSSCRWWSSTLLPSSAVKDENQIRWGLRAHSNLVCEGRCSFKNEHNRMKSFLYPS